MTYTVSIDDAAMQSSLRAQSENFTLRHCKIGMVRIKSTWRIGNADDWVKVEGPAW